MLWKYAQQNVSACSAIPAAAMCAGIDRARKQRMKELVAAKRAMSAQEYAAAEPDLLRDEAAVAAAESAQLQEQRLKFASLNK